MASVSTTEVCLGSMVSWLFTSGYQKAERFSSHFFLSPSLPSPTLAAESAKSPSSLLAFANHNVKLTILDSLIAAPRSEWQSLSSSSAEQDRSSSSLEGSTVPLPTQLIIRATFSAMSAGNLELNFTKGKVYDPKFSKRPILMNHFYSTTAGFSLTTQQQAGTSQFSRLAAEGTTQSPM